MENIEDIQVVGSAVYSFLNHTYLLRILKYLGIEDPEAFFKCDIFQSFECNPSDIDIRFSLPNVGWESLLYLSETYIPEVLAIQAFPEYCFVNETYQHSIKQELYQKGFWKLGTWYDSAKQFTFATFGEKGKYLAELLFVKEMRRQHLFNQDSIKLSLKNCFLNLRKMDIISDGQQPMQAFCDRISKTVDIDHYENMDQNSWPLLVAKLSKGWRCRYLDVEKKLFTISTHDQPFEKLTQHLFSLINYCSERHEIDLRTLAFNACVLLRDKLPEEMVDSLWSQFPEFNLFCGHISNKQIPFSIALPFLQFLSFIELSVFYNCESKNPAYQVFLTYHLESLNVQMSLQDGERKQYLIFPFELQKAALKIKDFFLGTRKYPEIEASLLFTLKDVFKAKLTNSDLHTSSFFNGTSLFQEDVEKIALELMDGSHLLVNIIGFYVKIGSQSILPLNQASSNFQEVIRLPSLISHSSDKEIHFLLLRDMERLLSLLEYRAPQDSNQSLMKLFHKNQDIGLSFLEEWILVLCEYHHPKLIECAFTLWKRRVKEHALEEIKYKKLSDKLYFTFKVKHPALTIDYFLFLKRQGLPIKSFQEAHQAFCSIFEMKNWDWLEANHSKRINCLCHLVEIMTEFDRIPYPTLSLAYREIINQWMKFLEEIEGRGEFIDIRRKLLRFLLKKTEINGLGNAIVNRVMRLCQEMLQVSEHNVLDVTALWSEIEAKKLDSYLDDSGAKEAFYIHIAYVCSLDITIHLKRLGIAYYKKIDVARLRVLQPEDLEKYEQLALACLEMQFNEFHIEEIQKEIMAIPVEVISQEKKNHWSIEKLKKLFEREQFAAAMQQCLFILSSPLSIEEKSILESYIERFILLANHSQLCQDKFLDRKLEIYSKLFSTAKKIRFYEGKPEKELKLILHIVENALCGKFFHMPCHRHNIHELLVRAKDIFIQISKVEVFENAQKLVKVLCAFYSSSITERGKDVVTEIFHQMMLKLYELNDVENAVHE